MKNTEQNAHVREFLEYYLKLASPQYAVMLRAPWGSGKTWFIKEYLKTLSEEPSPIYVTLNGVSSKEEIEEQFFEQMHPILAHKTTKVAAKVLKGFLKGTLKVDFDRDGRDDGTAAIGIPDVGIKEFINKSQNGSIIVFDDLERCELPVHQLLGYINYFVEHDNTRVILLANEDEIINKGSRQATEKDKKDKKDKKDNEDKEEKKYERVREKLVGKTFEIFPDVQSALNKFVEEVVDDGVRNILEQERGLISDLHASSKSNNLRHLRQALLDFERLATKIDEKTRDPEMIREILTTFLIYSFELRSGNLKIEKLPSLNSWISLMSNDSRDVSQDLQRKYPQIQKFDMVLSSDLWGQIIGTGYIDKSSIATAIRQSKFYAKAQDRPIWLRLGDAFEMDDDDLAVLLNEAEECLRNKGFRVLGELMHVIGSLVTLASIGVGDLSETQVVNMGIDNVNELEKTGVLPLSPSEQEMFGNLGWGGRVFAGGDKEEFQRFLREVALIKKKAVLAAYPAKAAKLLELLKSDDVTAFVLPLYWGHESSGLYAQHPVLAFIPAEDFVAAIAPLQAKNILMLARAIEARYQGRTAELEYEKPWLDEVANLMTKSLQTGKSMSDFHKRFLLQKIVDASRRMASQ